MRERRSGICFRAQDPGTVGGWLATRGSGLLSARYGSLSDLVLSLEAVDGAGEILRTLDHPGAGPDLTQLLLGSEGTLAILTSARLRIWPRPRERWLRAVRFPSLRDALRGLRDVLRAGLQPCIVRAHDPLDTLLAGTAPFRDPATAEVAGRRCADGGAAAHAARAAPAQPAGGRAARRVAGAVRLRGSGGGRRFPRRAGGAFRSAPGPAARTWGLRRRSAGSIPAQRARWSHAPFIAAGAFVETLDVATTWERAEPLLRAIRRAVEGLAFVRAQFAHAAAEGCALEVKLLGLAGASADTLAHASFEEAEADLEEAEERREIVWAAALAAAADEGATISHHSGIGASRQVFLRRELGDGIRQLRALKKAFDSGRHPQSGEGAPLSRARRFRRERRRPGGGRAGRDARHAAQRRLARPGRRGGPRPRAAPARARQRRCARERARRRRAAGPRLARPDRVGGRRDGHRAGRGRVQRRRARVRGAPRGVHAGPAPSFRPRRLGRRVAGGADARRARSGGRPEGDRGADRRRRPRRRADCGRARRAGQGGRARPSTISRSAAEAGSRSSPLPASASSPPPRSSAASGSARTSPRHSPRSSFSAASGWPRCARGSREAPRELASLSRGRGSKARPSIAIAPSALSPDAIRGRWTSRRNGCAKDPTGTRWRRTPV